LLISHGDVLFVMVILLISKLNMANNTSPWEISKITITNNTSPREISKITMTITLKY
jgi:hypothetical protein